MLWSQNGVSSLVGLPPPPPAASASSSSALPPLAYRTLHTSTYRRRVIDPHPRQGDFFITATSNKHAIDLDAIQAMKDGAVLSNAGQFDYEIDVKGLRKLATSTVTVRENMEEITLPSGKCVFLLGGGNLLNLSCTATSTYFWTISQLHTTR